MNENEIIEEARKYANKHSDEIIKNIVGDDICQTVKEPDRPITVFMAGSPGAGKTELSKHLIELSSNKYGIARIDADEFRTYLPHYDGSNSKLFQRSTATLVSNSINSALKHNKNFILDTTFSSYASAASNTEKALAKGRKIEIVYVYQEPESAWRFVQDRKLKEGRDIPPKAFSEAFVNVQNVINEILSRFRDVSLTVVIKDNDTGKILVKTGARSIDEVIKRKYNLQEIEQIIDNHQLYEPKNHQAAKKS